MATLKDPVSYVAGGLIAILMFVAAWMWDAGTSVQPDLNFRDKITEKHYR